MHSLFNGMKLTVRLTNIRTIHSCKLAALRTITGQTMIQNVPNTIWKPLNPIPNPPHTHAHTHARTHAHTHTHTHARTHAHTHTESSPISFWGRSLKLRKATITVVISVRLSAWNNSGLIIEYFLEYLSIKFKSH